MATTVHSTGKDSCCSFELKRPKLNDIHAANKNKASRAIVSHEEWLKQRSLLLQKEKELSRHMDEVTKARRELGWEKVDDYVFQGADGEVKLSQLFVSGKQDLVVQHLMFPADEELGCSTCSSWLDQWNGQLPHILAKANFVAVAKAPIEKLQAFRKLKDWKFTIVSSGSSSFNRDLGVEAPPGLEKDPKWYNYGNGWVFPAKQFPGISVFRRAEDGSLYHTYSTYARGLDQTNGFHQLMDLLPFGRDGFREKHKHEY